MSSEAVGVCLACIFALAVTAIVGLMQVRVVAVECHDQARQTEVEVAKQ